MSDAEVITTAPVAAFNFGGNVERSRSFLQETGLMPRLALAVERTEGARNCPAVLRFRGLVEASTGGQVRFRWRSSEGETTPYLTLQLNAGEAREIIHTQRVGSAGDERVSGWLELEVESAGGAKTARASFAFACGQDINRSEGMTGLSSNVLQEMVTEGDHTEENLLERFENLYLRRRGYSLGDPLNNRRARSLERLRQMRLLKNKLHVAAAQQEGSGRNAPGTLDASNCAWSSTGPTNINGRVTSIAIDPTNNQRVFVTSVGGVWRSMDGARRWQRVSDDFISTVFAFDPSNSKIVYVGDDGGLFRTGDTGGATWHWNNVAHNMIITEFYHASSQQALAGSAAGGTQDNGGKDQLKRISAEDMVGQAKFVESHFGVAA